MTTTTRDSVIDGACTLREAIAAANTNPGADRCTAGTASADLITFGRAVGTTTLASPFPDVTEALTIRLDK